MNLEQLAERYLAELEASHLYPSHGVSTGVGCSTEGAYLFCFGDQNGDRVQADAWPDSTDAARELIAESLRRFAEARLLAHICTLGDSQTSLMPLLIEQTSEEQIVCFAGRCIHLPADYGHRRVALERFFAASNGRDIALAVHQGDALVVATTPPAGMTPSPSGLAVYSSGEWTPSAVGGESGPLGTSHSLRTWQSGSRFVSTAVCHPRLNSPPGTMPPVGGSIGDTSVKTELLAQAEACERHLGGVIDPARTHRASLDDLGARGVDPRRIVNYLPWQYEQFEDLCEFEPDQPRLWVDVSDREGRSHWVLADLVFYPFGWGSQLRHTSTSSSGMAAHTSAKTARQLAVLELIERDAFMRTWLGERRGRKIIGWQRFVESSHLDAFDKEGWECKVVQIGEAASPVALAVARLGDRVALGASAGQAPKAIRKAMGEAWAQTTRLADVETKAPVERCAVSSPEDHGFFGLAAIARELPAFVLADDGEVDVGDLDRLPTFPDEIYFYEWEPSLSAPFTVVRALCPDLVPISFGYGQEPYGLSDVARLLAGVPQSLEECPDPHLFP